MVLINIASYSVDGKAGFGLQLQLFSTIIDNKTNAISVMYFIIVVLMKKKKNLVHTFGPVKLELGAGGGEATAVLLMNIHQRGESLSHYKFICVTM